MRSLAISAGVVVILSLLAAGCGGGGSPAATEPLHTTTVGAVSVGYLGSVRPHLSVSSGGVAVTGLSGAAFSYIDFYPIPDLQDTSILFTRGQSIWKVGYGVNSQQTQISRQFIAGQETWSPTGQIAFSQAIAVGAFGLFTMYPDGSHVTQVTGSGIVVAHAAWSPDGVHIAGIDASGNLAVMNANGTGAVVRDSAANVTGNCFPAWLTNTTLIYSRFVSGHEQLYTVGSASGSPTVYIGNIAGVDNTTPSVSPDGSLVVFGSNNGTKSSVQIASTTLGSPESLTPSTYNDSWPCFAPDGQHIAFLRQLSPTALNDGTTGVYVESFDGQNAEPLAIDPQGVANGSASHEIQWSPYHKYKRFIGSGGAFGTTASGFLFAQSGRRFGSYLSFTATTPSSAVITSATPSGGNSAAPQVFSVAADSLTRVVYTNDYFVPGTSITLSAAKNLVVSFEAATGQITLVAPLAVGSRSEAAKPKTVGGHLVFQGKFLGVYDGKGKNLASGGASQIEVDGGTGKLVSWR